jgi:hypothetical protein
MRSEHGLTFGDDLLADKQFDGGNLGLRAGGLDRHGQHRTGLRQGGLDFQIIHLHYRPVNLVRS